MTEEAAFTWPVPYVIPGKNAHGVCWYCRQAWRMRNDGTLVDHGAGCPGSGTDPRTLPGGIIGAPFPLPQPADPDTCEHPFDRLCGMGDDVYCGRCMETLVRPADPTAPGPFLAWPTWVAVFRAAPRGWLRTLGGNLELG